MDSIGVTHARDEELAPVRSPARADSVEMKARIALARSQQQMPPRPARDDAQAFEIRLQELTGVGR